VRRLPPHCTYPHVFRRLRTADLSRECGRILKFLTHYETVTGLRCSRRGAMSVDPTMGHLVSRKGCGRRIWCTTSSCGYCSGSTGRSTTLAKRPHSRLCLVRRRKLAMNSQVCMQRGMVFVNDGQGYACQSSWSILSIRSTYPSFSSTVIDMFGKNGSNIPGNPKYRLAGPSRPCSRCSL